MIGHNGGPSVEPGQSWRRHAWGAAREALLPTLPLEVVRMRVRRAAELGLDYKTYASVRAASGHDVVAFLFSSNALRVAVQRLTLPADRAEKLAGLRQVTRIALATAPLSPETLRLANPEHLDEAAAAPFALARFRDIAASLRETLGSRPGDRVILVGDHGLERDWVAAARLAAYLPAERYFGS
jgi:hypothetical protein